MEREKKILEAGIAGMKYAVDTNTEEGRTLLESLTPGTEIILQREPDNRFDQWAICLYTADKHQKLGYISRYKNETVARLMDQGTKIVAYVEEASTEEDPRKKKSATEDMSIQLGLYISDEVEQILPNSMGINYDLKKELEEFYSDMGKNKVPTSLIEEVNHSFEEVVWSLIGVDEKYVWQEIEFLEIYLGKVPTAGWFRIDEKDDITNMQKVLASLMDYENEYLCDNELSERYLAVLGKFTHEVISCDREVTVEEERLRSQYMEGLTLYQQQHLKEELDGDQQRAELGRECYEDMDISVGSIQIKGELQNCVTELLSSLYHFYHEEAKEQICSNYKYIFQDDFQLSITGGYMLQIPSVLLQIRKGKEQDSFRYQELEELFLESYEIITNAIIPAENDTEMVKQLLMIYFQTLRTA